MILHDLTPGMHTRRVRIFLAEKGVSIERREVDAAGKAVGLRVPPDMTHLSRWFAEVTARPTARA